MSTTLKISALATVLALCASVAGSTAMPAYPSHHATHTSAVGDPDPADCPFCGGNVQLHVKRIYEMERVTMGIATQLFR